VGEGGNSDTSSIYRASATQAPE